MVIYYSLLEPNHNGIFVFVGKSKSGMILRYFKTPEGGSNVPSYKRDCLFDKEVNLKIIRRRTLLIVELNLQMLTLASQSGLKPAPVIMVDGESMCTFVLGADALKDRMTTVYQGINYKKHLVRKTCVKAKCYVAKIHFKLHPFTFAIEFSSLLFQQQGSFQSPINWTYSRRSWVASKNRRGIKSCWASTQAWSGLSKVHRRCLSLNHQVFLWWILMFPSCVFCSYWTPTKR